MSEVDFTVEKPGRGIQLLVEARNTPARSPEWAARFLRNILARVQIQPAEYFLLALRDHLYLWRRPVAEPGNPDFEADTASELQTYLSRLNIPLDTLGKSGFEMLIQAWLEDLVDGIVPESGNPWLVESGLADSVRNGYVRLNLAA
jgi:hypothetical protein